MRKKPSSFALALIIAILFFIYGFCDENLRFPTTPYIVTFKNPSVAQIHHIVLLEYQNQVTLIQIPFQESHLFFSSQTVEIKKDTFSFFYGKITRLKSLNSGFLFKVSLKRTFFYYVFYFLLLGIFSIFVFYLVFILFVSYLTYFSFLLRWFCFYRRKRQRKKFKIIS